MTTSEQTTNSRTDGLFAASGETVRVRGEALAERVEEVIHEGNVHGSPFVTTRAMP